MTQKIIAFLSMCRKNSEKKAKEKECVMNDDVDEGGEEEDKRMRL